MNETQQASNNAPQDNPSSIVGQAVTQQPAPADSQANQAAPVAQNDQGQAQSEGAQNAAQAAQTEKPGVLGAYAASNEVPIEYKFTDANGAEVKSETANIVATMAKELNLTQEQAQNFFANSMGENGVITKLNIETLNAYNTKWAQEIENDPTLGGENKAMTLANVQRSMAYADDELKNYLGNAGLGNFPPLVRFLNKVGAKLGSDTTFIGGASPAKSQGSDEQSEFLRALYKDLF